MYVGFQDDSSRMYQCGPVCRPGRFSNQRLHLLAEAAAGFFEGCGRVWIPLWQIPVVIRSHIKLASDCFAGRGAASREGCERVSTIGSLSPCRGLAATCLCSQPSFYCRVAKQQPAIDGHNFIAVVLPIYVQIEQDLALLFKVLQHLSKQKRPADIIILVDDASPLPVPSIVAHDKLALIQLRCNRGPATARNCGIALAKERGANVICFLDADCQPSSDWIAMMERAQQETPGIVCGKTLADASETAVGLYHEVFGTLNGRMLKDGSVLYGCTCNLSISVAGVDLLFDTTYPAASFEDVEFCIRAKKNRIRMTYYPYAVVHHHFDPGWSSLFRQFQRYGRFERQTALKHREYLPWLWSSHEISCCTDSGLAMF